MKLQEYGETQKYSLQHEAELFKLSNAGLSEKQRPMNDGYIAYCDYIDSAEIRACTNEKGERIM